VIAELATPARKPRRKKTAERPQSNGLITIGVRRPGRADLGVEVNAEISELLAAGAPVAIGVSGGKDSQAAAIATVEHLDSIGHTGPRVLIHADLGRVEWEQSLPVCERLAAQLGLELLVVRRAAGGMMERWQKRQRNNLRRYAQLSCVRVILPWSTPKMRFCTSELKSAPMAAALSRRFPGRTIVSACGVRRAESDERRHAPTCKINNRLKNKARRTRGVDWNPIAHWSDRDVFAFIENRGAELHEGYTVFGMSRISCSFCIMAKRSDLIASASNPKHLAIYREMVQLEIDSTFAFQGSSWLGDVAPELLTPEMVAGLALAKERAAKREAIEKEIPKHLLYTKGWPTVMPTREEAEMLCSIRLKIAGLLGLEAVTCLDVDSLLARYAELMDLKRQKDAAKAAAEVRKAARASARGARA
jgi:3'-phosphoadenosine 5'-phosphosulfate sulfotransferase (PAPS reductase)/FAD synthetase